MAKNPNQYMQKTILSFLLVCFLSTAHIVSAQKLPSLEGEWQVVKSYQVKAANATLTYNAEEEGAWQSFYTLKQISENTYQATLQVTGDQIAPEPIEYELVLSLRDKNTLIMDFYDAQGALESSWTVAYKKGTKELRNLLKDQQSTNYEGETTREEWKKIR